MMNKKLLPFPWLDDAFIENLVGDTDGRLSTARLMHATHTAAAKLIKTPMRSAKVTGVALRGAHRRAGWWAATQLVPYVIRLKDITNGHAQGHSTQGHKLLGEQETAIVARLRESDPMASGDSEAFPSAMLINANTPYQLKRSTLLGIAV